MLRGLALRQGLLALNGVLAVTLALVVFLAVREVSRPEVSLGAVSMPRLAKADTVLADGSKHSRSDYDAILQRGMFGDAGKFTRDAKPEEAPPPPATDAQDTELPLGLSGTVLKEGPPRIAAAVINIREGSPRSGTFFIDSEVIDRVFLREIRPQEVILDNQRANRIERLRIEWKSPQGTMAKSGASGALARQQAPAAGGSRVNLVTLDRASITKKIEDEYARVASTLNVRVVNDAQGRPQGITTDNIENYESARELGLKNGDVLVSLNNEPVDSKERAVEVLRKYRSASLFRVGLLRGGQMQYLTYRVR